MVTVTGSDSTASGLGTVYGECPTGKKPLSMTLVWESATSAGTTTSLGYATGFPSNNGYFGSGVESVDGTYHLRMSIICAVVS